VDCWLNVYMWIVAIMLTQHIVFKSKKNPKLENTATEKSEP